MEERLFLVAAALLQLDIEPKVTHPKYLQRTHLLCEVTFCKLKHNPTVANNLLNVDVMIKTNETLESCV
jgi:hypothetical protein